MDIDDNEDPFGDDDFNDLPAATLQTLEQRALRSTQQRADNGAYKQGASRGSVAKVNNSAGKTRALPSSDYGFDNEEDVLDLDAQPSFVQQVGNLQVRPVDEVSRREAWRQQRYGQPQSGPVTTVKAAERRASEATRGGTIDASLINGASAQPEASGGALQVTDHEMAEAEQVDVSALQLRIHELETQAQTLQKAAEDAKSTAYSKSGEIMIIRANQQKETQEFERKMKLLQQQHAEEAAKAKADLDAIRKDREKYETNNRFLEHDLARETEKAKAARRTLKDGDPNTNLKRSNGLSTPKKNRSMPLRDGFDDMEVAIVSPSRSKDKSRAPSTPKADRKRKRSAHEDIAGASPGLSFAAPEVLAREDSSGAVTPSGRHQAAVTNPLHVKNDERFAFMQQILNHRIPGSLERTLEALSKCFFPSAPQRSVASIIYDTLTTSILQQDLDQFRTQICDITISQWKQCLEEKYYDPLHTITQLLQYILVVGPPALSASLIARLTPLCQSTIDIIAVDTAKVLIDNTKHVLPTRTLKSKIDPIHYLEMLHFLISHGVLVESITSTTATTSQNFWSHIEFDFILTLLHRAQPLEHVTSMVILLHHSVLSKTFGSIYPDATRQNRMEADLVDRLTKLLNEDLQHARPLPRDVRATDFLIRKQIEDSELERGALPVPEPYTALHLLELRSSVLDLLYGLVLSDHGGQLIATHVNVIARLVRFLHDSVVKMYKSSGAASSTQDEVSFDDDDADGHDALELSDPADDAYILHARNINTIVTMLYHLNTTYGNLDASSQSSPKKVPENRHPVLDIHSYLESHHGASQAYLVALSRIAFCEPWGLDEGIEAEVAEMAHEMLDEFVTEGDGEGVLEVFESGRTSGV